MHFWPPIDPSEMHWAKLRVQHWLVDQQTTAVLKDKKQNALGHVKDSNLTVPNEPKSCVKYHEMLRLRGILYY